MYHVRIKSGEAWEDKDIDSEELLDWFKTNTKDGAVTEEITLFADAEFKGVSDDTVEWTMSDMSLDRDMERVDPEGADFKSYKKNPVVLWAHDYTKPAIGKILNPKVKDGKVTGKVQFDSKDNDPFAYMIGQKVKAGIINGGSIGFKPNTVEFVEDAKDPTRLVHRKWELLEFSICNVPANFNALAAREVEDMDQKDKKELEAQIAALNVKIDGLDKSIQSVIQKSKSYVGLLLQDRSETSADTEIAVPTLSDIDQLLATHETSAPTNEKQLDSLFTTGGNK